ncbi:MAG: rod shape-determining protein RodA [Planctomycetota bacterium]
MRVAAGRGWRGALYWPLLAPAAALTAFGLLFLSGVVVDRGPIHMDDWHVRQVSGVAVGLALAVVCVLVPYKALVAQAYLLYAGTLALLVLVLAAGVTRNGAQRWIDLFGFDVQPSEVMKLTLVLTLARFIRFRSSYKTFKGLGAPFLLTLLPMALVLKQPDLGTALLCIPILFTMLFVAGARLKHLLTIVVLGTLSILPVYEWGLKPYQRDRVDAFLFSLVPSRHEGSDARHYRQGDGYQMHQSQVAIGSGGWTGVGLGEGHGHASGRVPERQTDFIFAVLGNEWGLFGGLLVLVLYALLLVAILAVAVRHRDPAGRLICVGVFALFAFQTFINLAMTVGLMPVTGLTLPFLSYGRSSMVASLAAVALVCNVAARPSYEFGRRDFD